MSNDVDVLDPMPSTEITSCGSTLEVRHVGDSEFSIRIGGHEIVVDLPPEAGGEDAGPSPTQLLVGSLAACFAFFGRGYLHARGLPDRVNVSARWSIELTPTRVDLVEINVAAPYLPSGKLDAFRRAIEQCTVHNTLRDPPKIVYDIVAGQDN